MRFSVDDIVQIIEALGLGRWSFSKLSLFEACPKAFQATYLQKQNHTTGASKFDAVPAKVGTFIHKVFETSLTPAIAPPEFLALWAGLVKSAGLTHEELLAANSFKSNVRQLTTRLHRAVDQQGAVTNTEHRMIHGPFICFTDLVLNAPGKPWAVLLDYKTHSRTKDRDAKVKDQLALNALLYFWCNPSVEEIKVGAVYVPDEDVVFFKVYRRSKDLAKLEQHWLKRCWDAMALIQEYKLAGAFPIPKKKSPVCTWCVTSCKRSKGKNYGKQ